MNVPDGDARPVNVSSRIDHSNYLIAPDEIGELIPDHGLLAGISASSKLPAVSPCMG